jgi:hypothetical protein
VSAPGTRSRRWARACLAGLALVAVVQAAPPIRGPQLGYVFPAGGRQGTTFHVVLAGQQLRGADEVYVTGAGVQATLIRHIVNIRQFEREQMQAARERLLALRQDPQADATSMKPGAKGRGRPASVPARPKDGTASKPASQPASKPSDPPEIDVATLCLRELEYYLTAQRYRDRSQTNPQLAQAALLEITIAADAPMGERELRLGGPNGLTNPLRFHVGGLPEITEQEPMVGESTPPTPTPPFVLNGQIMPGDVDKFRFQAKQGQRLVIDLQARRLVPYLADAVPGWFQATVALCDTQNQELAYVDDFRFNPDPILLYEVPADGEYVLRINDALYRGREDFVYRACVSELPFVTQIFPLGGRSGNTAVTAVRGWNLPRERFQLDTPAGFEGIRSTSLQRGKWRSNEFLYAVDGLPPFLETEPNNDREHAQRVSLPRVINGHSDDPEDVDVYEIVGRAGETLVAEVLARRLNSPLDSRLSISDAKGKVLAWNDDTDTPATGLLTHNADSYLSVKLPANGAYYVSIADAQQHGGEEYAYRLRLSNPRPDFELRLAPSSLSVAAGRIVPLDVHVLRKDGYDGEIELALIKPPDGFVLQGARLPRGQDRVRVTLAAPRERPEHPVALQLEGRATIAGHTLARPVIPADDRTQAFSYHHLVPAQEFLVQVLGGKPPPQVTLAENGPVRIPLGGTAEIHWQTPARAWLRDLELVLSDPPPGVTLASVSEVGSGITVLLRADQNKAQVGLQDNLIIEAYSGPGKPAAGAQPKPAARGQPVGYLPAVPIEIVAP